MIRIAAPFALFLLALPTVPWAQRDASSLSDFETWTWEGTQQSDEQAKQGKYSGKWVDLVKQPTIKPARIPNDWSDYDRLTFWLYSAKANGQRLTLVCNSENEADKEGWDYYFLHFKVDWTGWKFFNLGLGQDIKPTRKPLGWDQIEYLSINAGGWQHRPLADTVLYIDDVKLLRDPVRLRVNSRTADEEAAAGGSMRVVYELELTNRSAKPRSFELTMAPGTGDRAPRAYELEGFRERTPEAPANGTVTMQMSLVADEQAIRNAEALTREEFVIQVKPEDDTMPGPQVVLSGSVPLPRRDHPLLFGTAQTFERAKARAEKHDWANKQLEGLISTADAALEMAVDIPDEAGQWGHHYVCKKCGSSLRHQPPNHVCKRCGQVYSGWPYDQVIISGIHHRYWNAVKSLGLGYAFTGNEDYAQKAREILLGYADKYTTYPLHNVWNKLSNSAARIFAQTLDEAVAIITVAWGYDLIYNSPRLSDEDKQTIEERFFRQVVETIKRNNAGISNWQSWHNAGLAAVGFCLQDEDIASLAINGPSGFRFQLRNSILADGFWYEGTAAYHYYALDALKWTSEASHFAGMDFYEDPAYKSLYDAPLLYTFPDLNFPAVNDSDVFSITGRHGMYELAYARFQEPGYLILAQRGGRKSLEALLWGVDELPAAPDVGLASRDFAGLGAAVLRQGAGPEQLYAHLDYGPHGGGHGHQDKLAVILFGLGRQLAPDPGRLAYGAPMQGSWYRQTVAHNTLCVDERSQAATEGKLMLFNSQPGLAVAHAQCDTAYAGVMMKRTVALTDRYMIDILEASSEEDHTYDWLWHNFGTLEAGLPTESRGEPLATASGYQHFTDIRQATTGDDWSTDFIQEGANVHLTMVGGSDTELYFGMGMANKPPQPCPMVVARRTGKAATFISVIEPYANEPTVTGLKALEVQDGQALEVEIRRGQSTDFFLIAEKAGVERECAGVKTTARACLVRTSGGKPTQVHHVE